MHRLIVLRSPSDPRCVPERRKIAAIGALGLRDYGGSMLRDTVRSYMAAAAYQDALCNMEIYFREVDGDF